MRGLALTIALLFFTGTQARFPWQHEEPQTPLLQAREVIESYLNKIRDIGREAVAQAESSDIAKQLDLRITEKFDTFSANALAIKKQLLPYVDKVKSEVSAELEKDIPIFKEKIRPYVETFHRNWGAQVKAFNEKITPLADQLKKQTKGNLEEFYKNAQPQLENLRESMRSEVDSLRAKMAPYQEELRQKLAAKFEEVRANAGPKVEQYRAQFTQHVENLKTRLAPVVENLKEQVLPKVEEAKVKLAQLLQVLRAKIAERS
ncbi:apolipoprotein A-I [Gastrophryne carolinensis]